MDALHIYLLVAGGRSDCVDEKLFPLDLIFFLGDPLRIGAEEGFQECVLVGWGFGQLKICYGKNRRAILLPWTINNFKATNQRSDENVYDHN